MLLFVLCCHLLITMSYVHSCLAQDVQLLPTIAAQWYDWWLLLLLATPARFPLAFSVSLDTLTGA